MTVATTLDEFLATVRDAREYKRALVVQLCERGQRAAEVARLLQVSEAFISTCRKRYARDGIASFALGYQGGTSRLSADERAEVLAWLAAHECPNVRLLQTHLKDSFGVVYESRQSYYELLKAAKLSYKQSQAANPKKTIRRSRPNEQNSKPTSPSTPARSPGENAS
jgi:transposase